MWLYGRVPGGFCYLLKQKDVFCLPQVGIMFTEQKTGTCGGIIKMRRRKMYVFFMLMYLVTGYIVFTQKAHVDIPFTASVPLVSVERQVPIVILV